MPCRRTHNKLPKLEASNHESRHAPLAWNRCCISHYKLQLTRTNHYVPSHLFEDLTWLPWQHEPAEELHSLFSHLTTSAPNKCLSMNYLSCEQNATLVPINSFIIIIIILLHKNIHLESDWPAYSYASLGGPVNQ